MPRDSTRHMITAVAVVATVILAAHAAGIVFCPFRRITGFPCPGCGSTRAVLLMLSGGFAEAFRMNPLTTVLAPTFPVWPFLYGKCRPGPRLTVALTVLASLAVLANWGYLLLFRNIPG